MMMISKYLLALIFWPPNPSLLTSCLSLSPSLSPPASLSSSSNHSLSFDLTLHIFLKFRPIIIKSPSLVGPFLRDQKLTLSLSLSLSRPLILHSHMHHSHTRTWGTQMCSQAHTLPHTLSWEHAHTLSHPFKPLRTLSLTPSLFAQDLFQAANKHGDVNWN